MTNDKKDPEYMPDVRVCWTAFTIERGLLVEATGEYGADKFPVPFAQLEDFIKFLAADQTPYKYDGEFVLLPVVTRRTVRR